MPGPGFRRAATRGYAADSVVIVSWVIVSGVGRECAGDVRRERTAEGNGGGGIVTVMVLMGKVVWHGRELLLYVVGVHSER